MRRQLVAALGAVLLVLLAVDGVGLGEDLLGDLLVVAVGVMRRVGMHLRAVDRDHPNLDHPGLRAQPEDAAKQPRDRRLMTLPEPRDRRVIRAPGWQ